MDSKKKRRCFMSGKECIKYIKQFTPNDSRAFVLMPFNEKFFDIYEFGIKGCLNEEGIEAVNGRESYFLSGEYIICNICEEIIKAGLVVADLSEGNANVYYELGLAFALRRKCIVLNNNPDNFTKRFKNLINSALQNCILIEYTNINDIHKLLPRALNTLKLATIPQKVFQPYDKPFHVMAIVGEQPDTASREEQPKQYEVIPDNLFKYGIKNSLASVNERLPHSLIDLNIKNVENIATSQGSIDQLIRKLMTCQFCVIDINQASLEAFFWMGFMHGLGVNLQVKMRPDLSFLYISINPDMTKLPFDIQAVRVDHYKSVENASVLIPDEIVRRGIEKLKRHNVERHTFWRKMNFSNTKFLIGAADVYLPKGETHYRSKVSLQDFKTFDMITYLFILEQKYPFEYDRHFVRLFDYLVDSPEEKNLPNTETISKKLINAEPDGLIEVVRKGSDDVVSILGDNVPPEVRRKDYVILVGSSCANPATHMLFKLLYGKGDHYRFQTTKPYKARGFAWDFVSEQSDESIGIFLEESTIEDLNKTGFSQYAMSGFRENAAMQHDRDAGLLVVTNYWPENDEEPPKQTIVFSGFRKYGTYFMAHILAHYTGLSKSGELSTHRGYELKIKGHEDKNCQDIDFLASLNKNIDVLSVGDNKYCLEAIFEFFKVEQGSDGCEQWDARLTGFFNFNTKKKKRNCILNDVVTMADKRVKKSNEELL
jgi:hypothetical protein